MMVDTPSSTSSDDDGSAISVILSARVKVLQNEDILEEIFSYFKHDDDLLSFKSTRMAFLFASLTCKHFFKPASDLLWRRMRSLVPLFKVLPTFVKVNDSYTFDGAIQPAYLKRFKMYAGKIRVLDLLESSSSHIVPGHFIYRLPTDLQLFPALKSISLYDNQVEHLSPLLLSLGCLLRSISIYRINTRNESLVSSCLFYLSQKTPAVQEISLTGYLSSEILGFPKIFRNLRTINLTIDSPNTSISSFFWGLHDLPYLETLHLLRFEGYLGDAISESPTRGENKGFQALESLYLHHIHPKAIFQILRFIREAPKLRDVYLILEWTTNQQPSPDSVQGCITESCRVAGDLEVFELKCSSTVDIAAGSTSNTLAPLIKSPKLLVLEIRDVETLVNDAQIRELGESGAWRNLDILNLLPSNQLSGPSLTSLRILAQTCPLLTEVTIPIDFTLGIPEEDLYPRTSHPLQYLSIEFIVGEDIFGGPNITEQMAIRAGQFIEHYFPQLDERFMSLINDVQPDVEQWWNTLEAGFRERRALRPKE